MTANTEPLHAAPTAQSPAPAPAAVRFVNGCNYGGRNCGRSACERECCAPRQKADASPRAGDGNLPPLPTPDVQRAEWDEPDAQTDEGLYCIGWSQYHDESDPLPDVWDDVAPTRVVDLFTADQMRAYARAALAAAPAAAPAGMALTPIQPTPGLLMSMAIRSDHGLGIPGYYDELRKHLPDGHPMKSVTHAQRLESALRTMRQLHEEVVGTGFYKPEGEAVYAGIQAPATLSGSQP